MSTQCSYLYGIMPADKARSFGPIGMDGGNVRVVTHGALAMVASPAERIHFPDLPAEKMLQYLAEHQRVLERVMPDSAVIPMKFGTYAEDEEQVPGILQSGREVFSRALEEYAGKFELDLVASWADLRAILSEIAADPAVTLMKAKIVAGGKATMEQRLRLGHLTKRLLDERRGRIAAELVVALRALWPRIVVNETKDDSMILNAALLIDRSDEASFDQFVDQLNRDYEDRLDFRCVGPLPPYSFATAEVRAVDADELDAARQLLGLGESPGPAEIKAAYRRMLQEVHPDRNPDADAADRMKELVAAHELLEECALNWKPTPPAGTGGALIVKVRSLPEIRLRAGVSKGASEQSERLEPLGV
ncbi:MAG: GvpL/GvpF family gas vesicle protein [Phycisphaerae bacterium]|nr:GvpL/GvpF family gas vesicle protein [Phycisphaerae bacterium]